jgi:hypothetical protein
MECTLVDVERFQPSIVSSATSAARQQWGSLYCCDARMALTVLCKEKAK